MCNEGVADVNGAIAAGAGPGPRREVTANLERVSMIRVALPIVVVCCQVLAAGAQETAVTANDPHAPRLLRIAPRYYRWSGLKYAIATSVTGLFLGLLLWYYALNQADASVLAPLRGSVVLFIFVWSLLFLNERPAGRAIFGAGLVAAGIAVVAF